MGRTPSNETTTLLPHQVPAKPLKFPLGLVSERVRPYLELIRLEKVQLDAILLDLAAYVPCLFDSPPE